VTFLGRIRRIWIALDYQVVLPLLACLPLFLGRYLAAKRGQLYGYMEHDWRKFSFQDGAFHQRLEASLAQLLPEESKEEHQLAVIRRYQMQSLEEWEAACLIVGRDISTWPVRFEGLEEVQKALLDNPRVVFLTAHFGSSILGTVLLQKLGLPVLGMSSDVVEMPCVHPSISAFYRKKYAAMGRYLNGGEILHREGNMMKFSRFLKNRGIVVIVGDLPPDSHEKPTVRDFLGASRGFASGPVKLSHLAKAAFRSFVCEYQSGEYVVRFSEPDEEPYGFVEKAIRANPSTWWAADLLTLYPKIEPSASVK